MARARDPRRMGAALVVAPGTTATFDSGQLLEQGSAAQDDLAGPGELAVPGGGDQIVTIQAEALPGGILSITAATGYLYAIVRWGIGDAKFKFQVLPLTLSVERVPVPGATWVSVQVGWSSPGSSPTNYVGAGGNITVDVGLGESRIADPSQWQAPMWVLTQQGGVGGTLYGATTPQQVSGLPSLLGVTKGSLLVARSSVAAMPTGAGAAAFWLLFYDKATAPNGTDLPILRSKPLTAVGDWWQYSDELACQHQWATLLWVAASSTPGLYTAVGGGSAFVTVDLKVGQ